MGMSIVKMEKSNRCILTATILVSKRLCMGWIHYLVTIIDATLAYLLVEELQIVRIAVICLNVPKRLIVKSNQTEHFNHVAKYQELPIRILDANIQKVQHLHTLIA